MLRRDVEVLPKIADKVLFAHSHFTGNIPDPHIRSKVIVHVVGNTVDKQILVRLIVGKEMYGTFRRIQKICQKVEAKGVKFHGGGVFSKIIPQMVLAEPEATGVHLLGAVNSCQILSGQDVNMVALLQGEHNEMEKASILVGPRRVFVAWVEENAVSGTCSIGLSIYRHPDISLIHIPECVDGWGFCLVPGTVMVDKMANFYEQR